MIPETTLSSQFTLGMQILLPPFWILGCGLITANAWASEGMLSAIQWLLFTLLIMATSVWLGYGRLKRVRVIGGDLYISNYLKEIVVPLHSIEKVTENRWIRIHPVTIHLRDDTAFGRKIMFMPKSSMAPFWYSHSVVGELNQMVAAATAKTGP